MNNKNNVLKLSTCGSVDDGKSTLIGRLLYDTHSLKQDKLEAIERSSKQKGYDYLDFSLATDGLVAEREQGITIDVAHIYFSTPNRSYIIADTPGHIEYTRNMIVGASTSEVAIILIDARKGVIEQTRRHFFIHNLLRTKEVIVAVNKMDLVDYDRQVFEAIKSEFEAMVGQAEFKEQEITFIPISALHGDNVVEVSKQISWYQEVSLMEYLEGLYSEDLNLETKARLQVQTVIRPKTNGFHDYRGYAGKLKGGELSVGDPILVLPSKQRSTIKSIEFYDQKYKRASVGSSLTVTLIDDIHVARGDMLVKEIEPPREGKQLFATLCWMDDTPLTPNSMFYLQYGVKKLKAKVKNIFHKLDIQGAGENQEATRLEMNDLGLVEIQFAQNFHYDSYSENKESGAFILIDTKSNTTAAVGFIQ